MEVLRYKARRIYYKPVTAERKPDPRAIANPLPGDELAPWEEQFARWMALQTTRVSVEDEIAAIRVLVGHDLTQTAIKRVKKKHAWKRVYQNARAEVHEEFLKRARGRAIAIAPKAMRVYGKVVDALDRELEKAATVVDGKAGDALPAIRTAAPVLNPFLDRVIPRRTEHATQATQIVINLTPEQQRGLAAPVTVVSAEEVKAIPEAVS